MRNLFRHIALCTLGLACLTAVALAGDPIELRFADGSRWKGTTDAPVIVEFRQSGKVVEMVGRIVRHESLYVVVDGTIGGLPTVVTVFKGDLVRVRDNEGAEGAGLEVSARADRPKAATTRSTARVAPRPSAATDAEGPGVFVLPLTGPVGETFRHEEVVMIGEHADAVGPNQIIVLIFDSGGGGIEMEKVHNSILELKRRHRVVAWVKSAISAAAASAIACDEIYFMTEGTLGAMTGYSGNKALSGEALEDWKRTAGQWMKNGGREPFIAWAMIHARDMCSYDKDPITGEVTWYDDTSGQYVLSDDRSNLVFTSATAVHSRFAQGIADTEDDLARLLDLPRWREIDDYGRRIAADWKKTVEQAQREIPLLIQRRGYKNTNAPFEQRIGTLIKINSQLIQWWKKCPNVARTMLPPVSQLEREIEEWRKQLADRRN